MIRFLAHVLDSESPRTWDQFLQKSFEGALYRITGLEVNPEPAAGKYQAMELLASASGLGINPPQIYL
jgi:hypothetical protein